MTFRKELAGKRLILLKPIIYKNSIRADIGDGNIVQIVNEKSIIIDEMNEALNEWESKISILEETVNKLMAIEEVSLVKFLKKHFRYKNHFRRIPRIIKWINKLYKTLKANLTNTSILLYAQTYLTQF